MMIRRSPLCRAPQTFSENIFKRASRRDHDPFFRDGTGARKAFRGFRTQPAIIRYSFVYAVGFLFGAIIEIFACKTRLYESVMVKKDARRHDLDEFVVDFRKNVEKWQKEDMSKAAAASR